MGCDIGYNKDLGHFKSDYIGMLGRLSIKIQEFGQNSQFLAVFQISIEPFFVRKLGLWLIPSTTGTYHGCRHLVNANRPTSFDI